MTEAEIKAEAIKALKEMAILFGCLFVLIASTVGVVAVHEVYNVPPPEFVTSKANPSARSLHYWSKIAGGYVTMRTADDGKTWYKENGWFFSSRRLSLVDSPARLQEVEEAMRPFLERECVLFGK